MSRVSDWSKYNALTTRMSAEGIGFWRRYNGYDDFVRAVSELDSGDLWGREGSSMEGQGLDALIAELGESDTNQVYLRLRNAFTAQPASAYPSYRDTLDGNFLREDDGRLVYAPYREDAVWHAVERRAGATPSARPALRYDATMANYFHDGGWADLATLPAEEREPRPGDFVADDGDWRPVTETDVTRFRSPSIERPAAAGPRHFDKGLTRYYDQVLGWVDLGDLPAEERVPRIGDLRAEGSDWKPVTGTDIERFRARTPGGDISSSGARYFDSTLLQTWDHAQHGYRPATSVPRLGLDRRYLPDRTSEVITEETIAAVRIRYFSSGWTKLFNPMSRQWETPATSVKPQANCDMRSRSAAEPDVFVPVTPELLADRQRQLDQAKGRAFAMLPLALDDAPVTVHLEWAGQRHEDQLDQRQFAQLLDSVSLPGTRDLRDLKDECAGNTGGFGRTYLDLGDVAGAVGCGIDLTTEFATVHVDDDAGDNVVAFRPRVSLRFTAMLTPEYVTQLNQAAVQGMQEGTTLTYRRVGDTVVIDDTTIAHMPVIGSMLRLFADKAGGVIEIGTIRRTTHLRRATIKITGDQEPVAAALKAAGWKGLTAEDTTSAAVN